jgi:hypothetical protein
MNVFNPNQHINYTQHSYMSERPNLPLTNNFLSPPHKPSMIMPLSS